MTTTCTPAPSPSSTTSRGGATCAWCRTDFATIGELFAHVDHGHGTGRIAGSGPVPVNASR